jgi:DNA-binding response OmpR family regulator
MTGRGYEALELFEQLMPDIVLLDIGLPDLSGFDICREIRGVSNIPIIFITSRYDSKDIIEALRLGGDDYVEKPFDPAVVVARVQSNLRRSAIFRRNMIEPQTSHPTPVKPALSVELRVDPLQQRVQVGSRTILLTFKEMQLLIQMMDRPGQILTPEELYQSVWGSESAGDTRTVLVHISSLRKKLEPAADSPRFIHNVRGVGYKFHPPESFAQQS